MIYIPRSKLYRGHHNSVAFPRNWSNAGSVAQFWHGGYFTPTKLYNLRTAGSRDGTPGSAVTTGSGRFGNALKFGGTVNDYVDVGAELLQGQVDWTVSLWFNMDASGSVPLIFYGETNVTGNITLYMGVKSTGVPYFGLFDGSGNFKEAVGTTTILASQWYHYAATFSTTLGGQKVYLNGQLEGSDSNTGYVTGGGHADIGAVFSVTARTLNWYGMLDMISVWNRTLLPSEISWLYQNPCAFNAPRVRRNNFDGSGINLLIRSFIPCVD